MGKGYGIAEQGSRNQVESCSEGSLHHQVVVFERSEAGGVPNREEDNLGHGEQLANLSLEFGISVFLKSTIGSSASIWAIFGTVDSG
jgi:hypothetical protein